MVRYAIKIETQTISTVKEESFFFSGVAVSSGSGVCGSEGDSEAIGDGISVGSSSGNPSNSSSSQKSNEAGESLLEPV